MNYLFLLSIFCTSSLQMCAEQQLSLIERVDAQKGVYSLLPLPYSYNGLEPGIDTHTLQLHHSKHHGAYVDNLNKAIAGTPWASFSMLSLFENASELPQKIRNNAGGHWNHTFYWESMTDKPKARVMPQKIEEALKENFGSVEKFKELFRNAGLDRFGSGYVWLIEHNGTLSIISTANQDNPLMSDLPVRGKPLLVADVWEHAYYLKYQNKRTDYLDAFWSVVNWEKVQERFLQR